MIKRGGAWGDEVEGIYCTVCLVWEAAMGGLVCK